MWKLSAIKDIRFVKTTDGIGKVGNSETGGIKISQRGDMLYINGLNAEQTDVAIYDLKGRTMLRTKVADGEGIDASSLQHGVFIIKVKNTTFKFVKTIKRTILLCLMAIFSLTAFAQTEPND